MDWLLSSFCQELEVTVLNPEEPNHMTSSGRLSEEKGRSFVYFYVLYPSLKYKVTPRMSSEILLTQSLPYLPQEDRNWMPTWFLLVRAV